MSKKINITIKEACVVANLKLIKERIEEIEEGVKIENGISEEDITFIKFMAEQLKIIK